MCLKASGGKLHLYEVTSVVMGIWDINSLFSNHKKRSFCHWLSNRIPRGCKDCSVGSLMVILHMVCA